MTDEQISTSTIEPASTPAPATTPAPAAAPTQEESPANLDAALSAKYDEMAAQSGDEDDSLDLPDGAHPNYENRNPDGTFRAKNPSEPAQKSAPAEEGQPKPEGNDEPGREAPASVEMPNAWPKEMGETWKALPADVQQYVSQREHQAHTYISNLSRALKAYEPLTEVFEQQAHTFQRYNMTPQQWVSNLSKVQDQLDADPVKGIMWLADYYAQQAKYQDGASMLEAIVLGTHQHDPQAAQAAQQMTERERQSMALQRENQEMRQAIQQMQFQNVRSSVDSIASDKPHFDALIPDIAAELPGLRQMYPNASQAQLLNAAYERAFWANPQTRAIALQQQNASQVDAKRAEAAKAKRAASFSTNGHDRQSPPVDLDQLMRQTYDRMQVQ